MRSVQIREIIRKRSPYFIHSGYEYSRLLEYSFVSIIHRLVLLSRFSQLLMHLAVGKYYEAASKATAIRPLHFRTVNAMSIGCW